MAQFFTKDYFILWMLLLAVLLYLPVRQFIWVLYVRKSQKQDNDDVDEAEQQRLKSRASVTSGLLCLVFSYLYVAYLFSK